jgi:hypothetical protein
MGTEHIQCTIPSDRIALWDIVPRLQLRSTSNLLSSNRLDYLSEWHEKRGQVTLISAYSSDVLNRVKTIFTPSQIQI